MPLHHIPNESTVKNLSIHTVLNLGEPDTPYAICTFSFRLDHSLLHCVLLIAQIPIAESLELCTQDSAAFD